MEKNNAIGIVGICTGWLFPLAGIILGVVSLSMKEKNRYIGIISILEAIIFWGIWTIMLLPVY